MMQAMKRREVKPMSKHLYDKLNRFFRLEESGTTVRTEVLAGATSFIAVAYILSRLPTF